MLKLPKLKLSLGHKREKELAQKFRDKVEGFVRTIDSPIHVSDLLTPLKGYWQRVSPKTFSDDTIMFFNLGYSGHEYLLGQDDEGGTTCGDLCWSPDKRTEDGIVEVKITTKKTVATTSEDLHSYLEQVVAYMALEGQTHGELWIWYVAVLGVPKLKVYNVDATEYGLKQYKKQVVAAAKSLREALTAQDPTGLPLCPKTYCYRSKCMWYDECKPEGRWKPKKGEDELPIQET